MRLRAMLPLIFAVGCAGSSDDTDTDTDAESALTAGAEDLRTEFPAPDWADPVVFRSASYRIPAYAEKQMCFYMTWDGDTTALHKQVTYQSKYGHHFIIAATKATPREIPDGEVVDCTEADSRGMESFEPLLVGGLIGSGDVVGLLELPDGVGVEIEQGQRLVFQSHYLNTSDTDIVVQDELQFEVIAPEDVVQWAAPVVHTVSEFSIPVGRYQTELNCAFEEDTKLLFVGGHLHEWGHSYSIDWNKGDESVERIYEIAEWDPYFRDAPPYEDFGAGLDIKAGDTFTTTCAWDNDTTESLSFPKEMCATFGMMLGPKVPTICDDQEGSGGVAPF